MKNIYTIKDTNHTIELNNIDGGYQVVTEFESGGSLSVSFEDFDHAHEFYNDLLKGIYSDVHD